MRVGQNNNYLTNGILIGDLKPKVGLVHGFLLPPVGEYIPTVEKLTGNYNVISTMLVRHFVLDKENFKQRSQRRPRRWFFSAIAAEDGVVSTSGV